LVHRERRVVSCVEPLLGPGVSGGVGPAGGEVKGPSAGWDIRCRIVDGFGALGAVGMVATAAAFGADEEAEASDRAHTPTTFQAPGQALHARLPIMVHRPNTPVMCGWAMPGP
jgi:hypothetical protein